MARKFTNEENVNGCIAVRGMCEKAQRAYCEIQPLDVYMYENDDGYTRYAYKDIDGLHDELRYDELERELCDIYDIAIEIEEE